MSRKRRTNYTSYSAPETEPVETPYSVPAENAGQESEPEESATMYSPITTVNEQPEEVVEIPLPAKAYRRDGKVANCTMVNVRVEPDSNSKILVVINAGTHVDVFSEENGFYKVVIEEMGIEGFIMKDYVSV